MEQRTFHVDDLVLPARVGAWDMHVQYIVHTWVYATAEMSWTWGIIYHI